MAAAGIETDGVSRLQRFLLPGELLSAGDEGRDRRDRVLDLTLIAAALIVGGLLLGHDRTAELPAHRVVREVLLGLPACAALWWRRRYPNAVAVATATAALGSAVAFGAALVGLFGATTRASPRALAGTVGLLLVSTGLGHLVVTGDPVYEQAIGGSLLVLVLVGWGLFARARRQLVISLRERAERAELDRRLDEIRVRDAERRRIAREMHDVLAHRISLVSLHAGALEYRRDASREEVAEAVAVIREMAHTALSELREVIGVLRGGGDLAGVSPQATLADLPRLIDDSRSAGLRVTARIAAPREGIPDPVARAAYRVVQEAMTNARKHAAGAPISVVVAQAGAGLDVTVVSGPTPPGVDVSTLPGAGCGLVGLAERVGLLGGLLTHGRDADRRFVVRAYLPLER